ncbi:MULTISPECIES: hypothetical protein [Citrobacter]|uniref:hypothetical protein n=1 Tax=Citrobacter TaxID=544 RepID=UPI0024333C69|nr:MULTISPECIES: hypothetical protein [Citrobacter]MDM3417155.1 hypothetical protein [Citrobacter sp. Cb021]WFW19602.1 hypothetical protein NFJ61_10630 [Citrobacter braakii]WFY38038.1 hypothetical protein NFK30_11150 [Citrobacter braakii]
MSIKNLKDMITQQLKEEQDNEEHFDPSEQIKEYKELIERLYKLATDSLAELINENLIQVQRDKTRIYEEPLGEYEVDVLLLAINSKKIKFVPAGTMLIGSKGRVDVFGPFSSEKFMLIRKGVNKPGDLVKVAIRFGRDNEGEKETHRKLTIEDWEWKTLPSDSRWMKFNDVTSDTITDLIMRMING